MRLLRDSLPRSNSNNILVVDVEVVAARDVLVAAVEAARDTLRQRADHVALYGK